AVAGVGVRTGRRYERLRAEGAEVRRPVVHVAGHHPGDPGAHQLVLQLDLDVRGDAAPVTLVVVLRGVRRVVEVGEVRQHPGRLVAQQHDRHRPRRPVEVGDVHRAGAHQVELRGPPYDRVLAVDLLQLQTRVGGPGAVGDAHELR